MGKKKRKYTARREPVQKMTRDGLVEENRRTGEITRVSHRTAEPEYHRQDSFPQAQSRSADDRQAFSAPQSNLSQASEPVNPRSRRAAYQANAPGTDNGSLSAQPLDGTRADMPHRAPVPTAFPDPTAGTPSVPQEGNRATDSLPLYKEETFRGNPALHGNEQPFRPVDTERSAHDSLTPLRRDKEPLSYRSAPDTRTSQPVSGSERGGYLQEHPSGDVFRREHRDTANTYGTMQEQHAAYRQTPASRSEPLDSGSMQTSSRSQHAVHSRPEQEAVTPVTSQAFPEQPVFNPVYQPSEPSQQSSQEPVSAQPQPAVSYEQGLPAPSTFHSDTPKSHRMPESFPALSHHSAARHFVEAAVDQHRLHRYQQETDRHSFQDSEPREAGGYSDAHSDTHSQRTSYQESHSSGQEQPVKPPSQGRHRQAKPDTAQRQEPTSQSVADKTAAFAARPPDAGTVQHFSGQVWDNGIALNHRRETAPSEPTEKAPQRSAGERTFQQKPNQQDMFHKSRPAPEPEASLMQRSVAQTPKKQHSVVQAQNTAAADVSPEAPPVRDNGIAAYHRQDTHTLKPDAPVSTVAVPPKRLEQKHTFQQKPDLQDKFYQSRPAAELEASPVQRSVMQAPKKQHSVTSAQSIAAADNSQEAPPVRDNGIAIHHRQDTRAPKPETPGTSIPPKRLEEKSTFQQKPELQDKFHQSRPAPEAKTSSAQRSVTQAPKKQRPVVSAQDAAAADVSPKTPGAKDNGVTQNHRTGQAVLRKKQVRNTYREQAEKLSSEKESVLQPPAAPSRMKEKPPHAASDTPVSEVLSSETAKGKGKTASGKQSTTDSQKQADKQRRKLTPERADRKPAEESERSNRFRSIHEPPPKDASSAPSKKDTKQKKRRQQSRLQEGNPKAVKKDSRLTPDTEDATGNPGVIGTVRKGAGKAAGAAAGAAIGAAGSFVRGKIREAGEDDTGVEAAERAEYFAEKGLRSANRRVRSVSAKNRAQKRASRLQTSASEQQSAFHAGERQQQKQATEKKSLLNRRFQKQRNKKRAQEAAKAAKQSGKTARNTAKTAYSFTEKAASTVQAFFQRKKTGLYAILALVLILILLISQLQSCGAILAQSTGSITASSWPADDQEITKAELYYTQLEAALQKKIDTVESTYPGYDEYNYNVGEIGHDPVMLISYLCAKYGDFTFNSTIKQELDTLFQQQYSYSVRTANETRTVTKTVRAGDSIGSVVTSGYCNCTICCGQWSGGPTASGAYPTANHTVAVDAYNPIVPMGTQIIMNGTLYTVEDTGNLNAHGVDFDVYYGSHSEAWNHGHQTWEAYYAGGDGEEIEVTTTETVKVCYVTMTSTGLASVVLPRMNDEQEEVYEIYNQSRGNRQFLGSPVSGYWYSFISSHYGYRTTGGVTEMHYGLDLTPGAGTEILSVQDGNVTSIGQNSTYGKYIVIENDDGYKTLYAHCSAVSVSRGQTVSTGDVIGKVGSTGNVSTATLHIEFQYEGTYYNPYFYLSCEGADLPDSIGNATGSAAALIREAQKYLGTPYVWGGYSPSGFDCSGYVSYCLVHSGARNTGRLTANGLLDICTRVSKSQLQPGDLVFFQGTYNTSGASHVGIYIGSGAYGTGTFIHCGDPCKYGDLNSSYWTQHWLTGGRWY